MVDQVKKLISDCDTVFCHLRSIPPTSPWIVVGGPSIEGVVKQISGWLEDLADSAARMDVVDSPPTPPELYGSRMSTKRGIPVAICYVKDLRRWSESLLPKVNLPEANDRTHQTGSRPRGRPRGSDSAANDLKLYLDWKAANRATGITKAEFLQERGLPATAMGAIERGRAQEKRRSGQK